ncbi:YfiR family protein [Paucibacter sp. B2R-40]|uniref:YfiR family protein n=1 Tax=Paucibacter sp. B2R-40 TaxID=2893554 RepID=UPI0021E369CD|nr:YfiR family protein [Paucibacter sp. B2R-40]MCV2354947.1 YfiR family protein [Paucibacter sp. B2R-40]
MSLSADGRREGLRRGLGVLLSAGLCCCPVLPAAAAPEAQAGYSEYRLKAAFLYRISQFVEWPQPAAGGADSAFTICVLGSNPFGESLRELATRQHGNRPIALQYPASAREARACQIVYLDAAAKKTVTELASSLADLPVLTVSAAEQFVDYGGGVGFILEGGKLRMEINIEVLRRANLRPSAKLLEVAARLVGSAKEQP